MVFTDEILRKLTGWLEAEARASGLGPSVADDLASEVILRLLVANAREPVRSPFAYAAMILRNLIRDRIREFERAQRALEALVERSSVSVDPEDRAVECGDLVAHLLDRAGLTTIQAEVVHLIYVDGLSVADVADRLAKNPGTIHQHRERALEKLARAASETNRRSLA